MDFNHPAPFLAWLSKVPQGTEVRTYDGSGEWIKIYSHGLTIENTNPPINYPWNEGDGGFPDRVSIQVVLRQINTHE